MTARQAISAAYVYFCREFGEEKVDLMLAGKDDALEASENRQAVDALSELARMPRAVRAR